MSRPIAIRSLQCTEHAHNIPPTVLSCTWNIGKRCNYNCSYCDPNIHDAVSPFVDQHAALAFVRANDTWCSDNGKRIKYQFTGGEPFLDPSILDILSVLKDLDSTDGVRAITNGSVGAKVYERACSLMDELAVSLHFERDNTEIDRIIDTFSAIKSCGLHFNVMFLPGALARVKRAVDRLRELDLRFSLRPIVVLPESKDCLPIIDISASRKNQTLLSLELQTEHKRRFWTRFFENFQHDLTARYTQQELEYLALINSDLPWKNCGVWFDDGTYQELNTDQLIANKGTNFQNWTCYAGVDSIYVDFDGSVYRGVCFAGGDIGHISKGAPFATDPIVCPIKTCLCNMDISVRKSRHDAQHHVTGKTVGSNRG